jgi:hypothetical protein
MSAVGVRIHAIRRARPLTFLFVGVLAIATALIAVGTWFADDKSSDVALEAAKAGLQLGVLTIVSGVVAQGLKSFNDGLEDRRRLNEYRLTVFRDTVDAYHKVKTVRRTLRAAGLSVPAPGPLRADQVDQFDEQMRALNEAELSLERVRRELEAQSAAFANASAHLADLDACEKYLRKVLESWETRALLCADHTKRQHEAIEKLGNFLAKRRERRAAGDDTFWPSFNASESAMRDDLIEGPAPRRTRQHQRPTARP